MTLEEFWNSPEVLAAAERAKAKMEKDRLEAERRWPERVALIDRLRKKWEELKSSHSRQA